MNEIGPEALERWGLNVTKLWKDPRGRLPEFRVPWALVHRISPRVGRRAALEKQDSRADVQVVLTTVKATGPVSCGPI